MVSSVLNENQADMDQGPSPKRLKPNPETQDSRSEETGNQIENTSSKTNRFDLATSKEFPESSNELLQIAAGPSSTVGSEPDIIEIPPPNEASEPEDIVLLSSNQSPSLSSHPTVEQTKTLNKSEDLNKDPSAAFLVIPQNPDDSCVIEEHTNSSSSEPVAEPDASAAEIPENSQLKDPASSTEVESETEVKRPALPTSEPELDDPNKNDSQTTNDCVQAEVPDQKSDSSKSDTEVLASHGAEEPETTAHIDQLKPAESSGTSSVSEHGDQEIIQKSTTVDMKTAAPAIPNSKENTVAPKTLPKEPEEPREAATLSEKADHVVPNSSQPDGAAAESSSRGSSPEHSEETVLQLTEILSMMQESENEKLPGKGALSATEIVPMTNVESAAAASSEEAKQKDPDASSPTPENLPTFQQVVSEVNTKLPEALQTAVNPVKSASRIPPSSIPDQSNVNAESADEKVPEKSESLKLEMSPVVNLTRLGNDPIEAQKLSADTSTKDSRTGEPDIEILTIEEDPPVQADNETSRKQRSESPDIELIEPDPPVSKSETAPSYTPPKSTNYIARKPEQKAESPMGVTEIPKIEGDAKPSTDQSEATPMEVTEKPLKDEESEKSPQDTTPKIADSGEETAEVANSASIDGASILQGILESDAGAERYFQEDAEKMKSLVELNKTIKQRDSNENLQVKNFGIFGKGGKPINLFNKMNHPEEEIIVAGQLIYHGDLELPKTGTGILGVIKMRVSKCGIWWLEPQPIIYFSSNIDNFGEIDLELRDPLPRFAAHPESHYAETIRYVGIADVLLYSFWDQNPDGRLKDELERARKETEGETEEDDDDIIELDRPDSLNSILLNREAVNLLDLMKDETFKEFLTLHASNIDDRFSKKQLMFFWEFAKIRLKQKAPERPLVTVDPEVIQIDDDVPFSPSRPVNLPDIIDAPTVVTPRLQKIMSHCIPQLIDINASEPKAWRSIIRDKPFFRMELKSKPRGTIPFGTRRHCKEMDLYDAETNKKVVTLSLGQFVRVPGDDRGLEYFLQIQHFWVPIVEAGERKPEWNCHGLKFKSLDKTFLLASGDPNELTFVNSCADIKISEIAEVVKVELVKCPDFKEWQATDCMLPPEPAPKGVYSLRFKHQDNPDGLRFEYLTPEEFSNIKKGGEGVHCLSCRRNIDHKEVNTVKFLGEESSQICGETFYAGEFVFLAPESICLPLQKDCSYIPARKEAKKVYYEKYMDGDVYPEADLYLKKQRERDFRDKPVEPYMVAKIIKFIPDYQSKSVPSIVVLSPVYRASDLPLTAEGPRLDAISSAEVYLSIGEDVDMGLGPFKENYRGRAFVKPVKSAEEGEAWAANDPRRLYSRQVYMMGKKGEAATEDIDESLVAELEPKASLAPGIPAGALRGLELYAGAGGLSQGLEEAGIVTKTAVELNRAAAETFRQNHGKDCQVMNEGVNTFLNKCLKGTKSYPKKGDFNMISGGPPCQGFSTMNMFKESDNSKTKNMLVTSQLSVYDFFRPDYALLENVQGLSTHSGNTMGKKKDDRKGATTLNAVVAAHLTMGYQVSAQILNAGAFGVPQNRNRTIIMGAAPGRELPEVPMPVYCTRIQPVVFPGLCQFKDKNKSTHSASRGEVNVYNMIGDLPDEVYVRHYDKEPTNHFQRKARRKVVDRNLANHESRTLRPLEKMRVELIPPASKLFPEPNWQLLPNIIPNGFSSIPGSYDKVELLNYKWARDRGAGQPYLQMACECWEEQSPETMAVFRKRKHKLPQTSIIPPCMAHTKKYKNGWVNCYGRVTMHLWFTTITCNDTLTQNTGRILHPFVDRILSVRELARGQGFPDHYRFYGRLGEMITQVGNAVPAPLATALGKQVIKAHFAPVTKKQVEE